MLRLLDHLKALGLGNHPAREALKCGKVWYRGVPTADAGRLVDPAEIQLRPDAPRITVGRDPMILHVDDALVVVWKPAGVLSVSAPYRRDEGSLVGLVARRLGRLFVVHRLDEGTSGVLVLARTEAAQQVLKDTFEAHRVERRYLAVVGGHPPEAWTVKNELVRDRGDGLRGSVDEGLKRGAARELHARQLGPARTAITHFRRVRRVTETIYLVEATLETGRTHQVRIHLAEAGYPVLGDELYAPRWAVRRGPRLSLHAAVLGFPHPLTGDAVRFEVPLADDLERWCREESGAHAPVAAPG